MIVGGKIIRGLLHVVLQHVRMDLNCAYRENEDDRVVVSSTMKHAIFKVIIAVLGIEKNRNILEVLAEPMQDPIEEGNGPKERIHRNRLQRSSAIFFFHFLFIHLLGANQISH